LSRFEDILVQCIDDIKAGRSSIEDCLSRYPSLREQLEPLLRIALEIHETPDIKPSPAFKIKARVQLMEHIHDRQAVTKRALARYGSRMKPIQYRRRFSMAGIIIAIVLALSAAGGGAVYASQGSLPGDTLYQVKLGTEHVRMMLPGDDVAKAERALSFVERRVEEMQALAREGRPEDMGLAVEKHDDALKKVLARMELASDGELVTGNITALVAEATARHLSVLDTVCDMVPDEAKPAITRAREASLNGQRTALAALARNNPIGATEMNLQAMNGRLNRARTMAEQGNSEEVENAVALFEEMGMAGEDIAQIAQEAGIGVTEVEELLAQANARHLSILDDLNDGAPHQAGPAIARARQALMNRFRNCLMALANENPARAMEINLTAMRERLGRAEARAEHVEAVESALEQFETMAEFGEEISRVAQEVGKDEEKVEELLIEATSVQVEVLIEVWERVAEQARPAIERVMAKALIRHEKRVQALERRGIEAPELPVMPPMVRERVEERMREQRIWEEREGMLGRTASPGAPGRVSCPRCRS